MKIVRIENKTREHFYEIFAEKGYTVGCEVGVYMGGNAFNMFQKIPNLKLYLVDPYMTYSYSGVKRRSRNKFKWHQPAMDKLRHEALRKLSKSNVVWLMVPSKEASLCIPDGSLDFVYIDANHQFPDVMQDIVWWAPKIRKGGTLSGHDYGIRAVKVSVDLFASRTRRTIYATDKKCEGEGSKGRITVSWMMEM